MSKTERREVYTTREVRTLSPHMRTLSNENLSEFNNNLDHLLEDLQSSVSRPGSSLGNTYRETRTTTYGNGKGDSLSRVQHLTAANPTTIVSDDSAYTFKPGETVKTVKIVKEDYGTINMRAAEPGNTGMQNNINKLDSLLDDLQQARQGTLNRDAGIDPGLLEPSTGSKQVKKTVHRELVYDKESSQRNRRAGSVEREIIVNDGTYGDLRRQPSPNRSGTLQSSKSYNYSSENRSVVSPKTEIIETTLPDINPNVLAQLDPNLLPPANTKVTTTIKTYTYEIPGSGYPSAVSPKLSETVYSTNPSTPSQSFHYNKAENTSTSNITNYPGSYVRPVSPNPSGYSKHVETTTTTRNVSSDGRPKLGFESPSLARKTYIHDETNTSTRTDYPYTRTPRSPKPSEKQVHIYNETTTTNMNQPQNGYPTGRYPGGSPGTTHHTYIHETNTSRNVTRNGYPPNQDPGYPPKQGPDTTIIYKQDSHTTNNYGHPNQPYDPRNAPPYGFRPGGPGDNVNITYKYTSHSTNKNNYRGYPNDEAEPLLHPRPFPTDRHEQIDGPPKQLDKLLAEMGNEPPNNAYNAGYNAKQAEIAHKKEVDKLTESSVQKKVDIKDLPKSKNVAGPPVYYPPGEMFTHKEESSAWRAEGGKMKESGKYKYEASSKSKEKSSSGMAVVPVCLPLCCGLPCTII